MISTARESAAEALAALKEKPVAAIAFDCAGRKGKLTNIEDELRAVQESLGKTVPLFGCYCAGEIGPADVAAKAPGVLSSGEGWHVMFTALAPKWGGSEDSRRTTVERRHGPGRAADVDIAAGAAIIGDVLHMMSVGV